MGGPGLDWVRPNNRDDAETSGASLEPARIPVRGNRCAFSDPDPDWLRHLLGRPGRAGRLDLGDVLGV